MYSQSYSTAFLFSVIFCLFGNCISQENVKELPFCTEKNESGAVIVSTLDGKLSALNSSGNLLWQLDTGPGPLLVSNIHKLELTNNGEWIRIIPSLSGVLYKFDGSTIDPIPITAESLLKSSFRYSDDLVIAGGTEKRTYGVDFRSGEVMYECTASKCLNNNSKAEDVILIERSTQTIRAVEPRSGNERWNFSVGLHDVKVMQVSCFDQNAKLFDWNISAVLPEGLLRASHIKDNMEQSWQYKFAAPIVNVWRWDGRELISVNLFAPKSIPKLLVPITYSPAIYIGMHNKQLYIHESVQMQHILQEQGSTDLVVTESQSIAKIPWKPIPASHEKTENDSTALAILNASEYVNGNGYYLYTEEELKDHKVCKKNKTLNDDFINSDEETSPSTLKSFLMFIVYHSYHWWKETLLLIVTMVAIPLLYRFANTREIITVHVEHPVTRESESSDPGFSSRYMTDFDPISCLGKGGFGIVFEAKKKIDECHYAIKRITLPYEQKSRDRVMREVKALAKLDHQNIVRYFNSWVEHPPYGWQQEHDKEWVADQSSFFPSQLTTSNKLSDQKFSISRRSKSVSVAIDIDKSIRRLDVYAKEEEDDDEDDFIVFENDDSTLSHGDNSQQEDSLTVSEISTSDISRNTNTIDSTISSCATVSVSHNSLVEDHSTRKINWRRPGRRHHSWDQSQNTKEILMQEPNEPPMFLYIQMQLCKKESLKDWLTNHHDRDFVKIRDIFSQILSAVEYVHLQGLIHRDLKPGNIFFALDGQIKVGDFGLVKDMEDSIDLDGSKASNKVSPAHRGRHTFEVGTQLYMSPEQFTRSYNYKVDIYSLGLILFELLVPFSTDMERITLLTKLKNNEFPKDFPEKYPDEYNLLKMMVCVDPKQRLTTIGIRARPPFNLDSSYGSEYHFSLPNQQKH